ncbi:MAG: hypothetical protein ACTSRK_13935 [Promethearchaeota archaeon]
MAPRRSDKELIEQMLEFLNGIKLVTTEGKLAAALNINSETANKWLEIFLLIKKNCPDFQYKKTGRYRIIDMVGLGNLALGISKAKLKHVAGMRVRTTRFKALNTIVHDVKMIARIFIKQLKLSERTKWNSLIEASEKALAQVINLDLIMLAGPEGKDTDFQSFKSSLKTSIEVFVKSIKDLEAGDAIKPKLNDLERDFIQKIVFNTQKFEESEVKAGKRPNIRMNEMRKPPKTLRGMVMNELKVNLDNKSSLLKKPKWDNLDRMQKIPKSIPILRCDSCNFERHFPIHCSKSMEYEDGTLICRKCDEKMPIPKCTECNQALGIGILELESDQRAELN